MNYKLLMTLAFLAAPSVMHAQDYTLGDLQISHPMAKPTAATAMSGAGYLSITNTGDSVDTLLSVEAEFPRVMLHDVVMDGDVARMEHLMGVDIPAGETVTFAPGGKHVMFMGLNGDPFEVGEEIPGTLVFEKAGRIDIVFRVQENAEAEGEADHSGH